MRFIRATRKRRADAEPSGAPGGRGRAAVEALLVLLILGVVGYNYAKFTRLLWRLGEQRYPRVVAQPEVRFYPDAGWLSAQAIRELGAEVAELLRHRGVLSPELPGEIAGIYHQSPWVARVGEVRRQWGGRFEVVVMLREPAAVVVTADRELVMDREAVLLPVAAGDVRGMRLPRITGLAGTVAPLGPPPPAGQPWEGRARIVKALAAWRAAAEALAKLPPGALAPRFELAGIDFGPPPPGVQEPADLDPEDIVLTTAGGSRIHWGAFAEPGEEGYLAFTTGEKQQTLGQVLQRFSLVRDGIAYTIHLDKPLAPCRPITPPVGGSPAGSRPLPAGVGAGRSPAAPGARGRKGK